MSILLAGLVLSAAVVVPPDDQWYQWRGPNRDGLSPDTGLLKKWPAGGPPLAWKVDTVGGGFSSVSIWEDKVFTLGDVGDACMLIALDARSGKTLWSTRVGPPKGHKKYPGPRCTPTIDGESVYALGQLGDLVCVDIETGRERWRKNLVSDYGGSVGGWKYSESPLLDGDRLICTPGGKRGAVLALNKKTGAIVWQSGGFTEQAQYASLVPAEIGGVRQYLVFVKNCVAGISARDGRLLWRGDRGGKTAICTTPIHKDGVVFVSSAYGVGHNAYAVSGSGGSFQAKEIYAGKQMENHHGGLILKGDHVFGLDNRSMKCIELKTGKVLWEDKSVGKGSIAYADGHFVVRSENQKKGTLALVEATPEAYREKGRFDLPGVSSHKTWAHPVIFGGRLYVRDQQMLYCFDVREK